MSLIPSLRWSISSRRRVTKVGLDSHNGYGSIQVAKMALVSE
jgi:hypothetical protein